MLCSMSLSCDVTLGWQDSEHHWLQDRSGTSCSSNTSSCDHFHTEKKSYWQSYVSDPLDLDSHSRNALSNEDNKNSRRLLHCLSLCSQSNASSLMAGIKPSSQQGECEASVDELTGTARFCGMTSSSSWSSCSTRTHGTTVQVSYRMR